MEAYTGSRDQWADFLVERCFILHIDDGGSRRRGAVETRRPMRGDGLTQEEVVVCRMVASMTEWPDKVEASISALKADL